MGKQERTELQQRFHLVWKKYYKPSYRIVAFALCAVLMVLCFPRVGKFNYEYEVQRPWRYETLVAPFDIPLYKTPQEFQADIDSVMKQCLPIYVVDSIVRKDVSAGVAQMLQSQSTKIHHLIPASVSTDTLSQYLLTSITNRLMWLYGQGIVEVPQTIDAPDLTGNEVMLVRSNVAEVVSLDRLYTLRKAYSTMTSNVTSDIKRRYGGDYRWISQLVQRLPFDAVVIPNVHYDEGRTKLAMSDLISNVATFSGTCEAGTRIVGAGEIVDKKRAKILDSLKRVSESHSNFAGHELPVIVGESVMIVGLLLSVWLFLLYYRKDYFRSLHYINLILILMTSLVCMAGLLAGNQQNISYLIPYSVLPVVLRLFADSRLAMYVHTMTVLIISLFAHSSQLFILLHIPAGLVACISLYNLNKRSQLVRTYSFTTLSSILAIQHGGQPSL